VKTLSVEPDPHAVVSSGTLATQRIAERARHRIRKISS
jgi:hypothetical protein